MTAFGARDSVATHGDPRGATLDAGDEGFLVRNALSGCLAPDAAIVMGSCSTGHGRGQADNIANLMARVFPGRSVYAPLEPTCYVLALDDQGKFTGVTYLKQVGEYRARVEAPGPAPSSLVPDWQH